MKYKIYEPMFHNERHGIMSVADKFPSAYFLSGGKAYINAGRKVLDGEQTWTVNRLEHSHDLEYAKLLIEVLHNGTNSDDRTGIGTISDFGKMMRFDLQKGFPLLTTKKLHWKSIVGELLWFIGGCKGGIQGLKDLYGVTIWDEWLDLEKQGYGIAYEAMTKWESGILPFDEPINQLRDAIELIKKDLNSRRNIVLNWNPADVRGKLLVLPACHTMFQFKVVDGKLSTLLNLRSNDLFLGNPYNIASYALLTHLVAHECNLDVGELIVCIGDAHIYKNHLEQVKTQLLRLPYQSPTIKLNYEVSSVFDFKPSDIELIGYQAHPIIKAEVAV